MEQQGFYSRQAEEAVLGAVLIDSDTYRTLPISAQGDEFQIDRNKFIWQAITALHRAHEPIDYLTVCDYLEKRPATVPNSANLLGEIGGPAYIMSLINQTPSSLNADAYARIVIEHYDRRNLIANARAILNDAANGELSVADVVTRANMRLANAIRVEGGAHHISEDVKKVMDFVEARLADPSAIWGLPTGFPALDEATGGLQRGWLIIMQGAPGIGKSKFLRQLVRQVALALGYPPEIKDRRPDHHNVLSYSLEMADVYVTKRDISAHSQIPTRAMNTGFMDEGQVVQFVHAAEQVAAMAIYQTDRALWTPAEMRADIARLKAKLQAEGETLDLIVIDYLGLMVSGVKGEKMQDYEKEEYLTTEFKSWAREFDVPVLAINAMTKSNFEDGKPGMGAGHGGAKVFYNPDLILNLTRTVQREDGPKFPPELLKRLLTVWFTKGRELEQSDGHFDLIAGVGSPWLADAMTDPQYAAIYENWARTKGEQAAERETILQHTPGYQEPEEAF